MVDIYKTQSGKAYAMGGVGSQKFIDSVDAQESYNRLVQSFLENGFVDSCMSCEPSPADNPDLDPLYYFSFASMKEAVSRRYSRLLNEQADMPDLLLIDGGIGQVNAVEEILNSLPEIKESACIGIPDIVLGEVVKAFIVADENIDNKTIFNALKPKLEAYKIPVAIERLNELPKTNSGKIQRLKLKEL